MTPRPTCPAAPDIRQLRSTVFAIWSHLLKADEDNLVMIKANYWVGL
jgi:hypothetical protein